MARSKSPFIRSRPRTGTLAGSVSTLRIPNKISASVSGFTRSRNHLTDNLLVSDTDPFVCKDDEGVVGDPSPVGRGRLIRFADHKCDVYVTSGICLLCGKDLL